MLNLYIEVSKSRQIEVSRGVKTSVEKVSSIIDVDRCNCRGSVEEEINKKDNKQAQLIHQLLRSYRGSKNFVDQST